MAQSDFNRAAALLERLGVATRADVVSLYAARAALGFGDGFAAIMLPAYLLEIGFDPFQIGLVATAALLGSAATTLAIGFLAPRYHLRTLLLLCAANAEKPLARARAEALFNERALREGLEIDRVVFDALVVQRARKGALAHFPTCGSLKFHPVGFARAGRITSRPRARNQGRSLSARGLLCSHGEHRARRRVPRPTSKN